MLAIRNKIGAVLVAAMLLLSASVIDWDSGCDAHPTNRSVTRER